MAQPKTKTKTKTKRNPKGAGRKSAWSDSLQGCIRELYQRGCTDREVAAAIGVTDRTLNNWKKTHANFFSGLEDWRAGAVEKVERSMYERAIGYSHKEDKIFCVGGEVVRAETIKHYPPDTSAGKFILTNKMPEHYQDKIDVNNKQRIIHVHMGHRRTRPADDQQLSGSAVSKSDV